MAEDALTLLPRSRAAGTVRLPGSKSLTNRALLLAALAQGPTRLGGVLHSDDTRHMQVALRSLGVHIEADGEALVVTGNGGPFDGPEVEAPVELFLGNSGTSCRSLAAVLPAGRGAFILSGEPRLHERPIGDLVDALEQLGGRIEYLHSRGYPPLRIRASGLAGGTARIAGALSSQFVSGLLMAAPLARGAVRIEVEGALVSVPYVRMTLTVMEQFGVSVPHRDLRRFDIAADAAYESPGTYVIEGDASGASYFLAAGAIGGGPVRVEGAGRDSLQGDVAFADVLEAMGARVTSGPDWIEVRGPAGDHPLRGVDMDLNHIPDAAMTLATTALFARGSTRIRNVYNWRLKETDRLAAMARELRKVGATVDEGEDSLTIRPPAQLEAARIETYDDHRMAMCFALVAFGDQPVTLVDPNCVNKTFPTFFDAFERVTGSP